MTTQHDYEAALDWHRNSVGDPSYLDKSDRKNYRTIERALKLAAKVMQEASQTMAHAAVDVHPWQLGYISPIGLRCSPQKMFKDCFAAMIQQAVKEIENDPK